MLDAMIASVLKTLLNTQMHFRKRVSVEEQRAQKHDRFSRGRQIAYMIYEYFRATGAYEAVQGLLDRFTTCSGRQTGSCTIIRRVQTCSDRTTVSGMPSDMILEGLYKSKLQNSAQLQTVLALYDQETARNKEKPNYSQVKTTVKLHIGQMMRTRNFRVRSVTKSQKGKKAYVERKVEECFQWKAHGQCVQKETHVVSVMTDKAPGNSGSGQRRKGHPIRRQNRLTAREKSPQRDQAIKRKALWTRVKFHADTNSVITRHVSSGVLPCVRI